ncbi:hypothetical protein KAR91_26615 [Candidatus Pacearchaeota archaeon]|nr:hypothetical protein [Candidatus Pacearchaeota archaeon]
MLKVKMNIQGKEVLRPISMLVQRILKEVGVLAWRIMLRFIPVGKKDGGFLRTSTNVHKISRWKLYVGPLAIYARAQDLGLPGAPGRYVPAIQKRLTGTKSGVARGWWPGFKGKFFTRKTSQVLVYKAPLTVQMMLNDYFGGG